MKINKLPNVKIICPECNNFMIREKKEIFFFTFNIGWKCEKCNYTVSRTEIYNQWDLDYKESWHLDVTKEPEFSPKLEALVEGKTIEEIDNNPYLFAKTSIGEAKQMIEDIHKYIPNTKKKKKYFRKKGKKENDKKNTSQ